MSTALTQIGLVIIESLVTSLGVKVDHAFGIPWL